MQYHSIQLSIIIVHVFDHCIVIAVHIIYLEFLQAHVASQPLKKLTFLAQSHVTSLESQFLQRWVSIGQSEEFVATDADKFGVVAEINTLVR